MPQTNELTRDYQSAASEAQSERVKVALVKGPGLRVTAEVQDLLRRRLRFVSLVATAAYTCTSVIYVFQVAWTSQPFGKFWLEPSLNWTVWLIFVLLTGILWSRRPLSLGRLRTAEIVLFSLPLAHTTWYYLDQLWLQHLMLRTFREQTFFVSFIVSTFVLPFVVTIMAYGTLVPNTGRRCGLVVTAMASVPMAVVMAVGFVEEPIRTTFLSPFLICLAVVVIWMSVAVALAVHGSHRIEVLRREAFAARQMGQYRLKERLGAGGMGEVYLAEHVLLRRPCALKLIRPERAGDPNHLLRFEREVQATAALTHPNTIQVFDYGHADDGTFYYAMEYLAGLNLEQMVTRHGPLLPERAVHILRQVCGALHEAHAAGLIHRDIKPNNIITCERGGLHDVAKLLDFGLVRSHGVGGGTDNLTQEGAITGTPAYMSPEQADGHKELDARSDLYSLGAVAYYLLTGQPPFVRPTSLQMLIAHACDRPIPPDQLRPEVPLDLQAVVLRCLAKDPAQRFSDARSLDRELATCQAAGLWTEERAVAWWHAQTHLAHEAAALADAATRVV
jgi:eukaryotic-like serine/threonine-protein kinase